MHSNLWVEEKHENFSLKFKVNKVLFSGKSEFQTVDVVETEQLGNMLLNDGLIMCTEKDEFIYHDMIAHVPLFVHPNPKKVLVIGGGDGGTAREVLRHPSVEKCVMVEIDKMVVDASIAHLPITACAFENPKLELHIDDGLKFVKNTKEKFEVILVDSTDPIGPAQPLFGKDFYQDIYNCLSDDGIVVSQGESPFYEVPMQKKLMGIIHEIFPKSLIYNFSNLTYPGGLWSFTFGSKKYHPIQDFNADKVKSIAGEFKYYNEQIHSGAFFLPSFMKKELQGLIKE
ncbi:MAG: spermidine synthase [Halobacteriovoraceae bacterium]|nr:spermidine synthase [Halobacteriovoraceae bacterium]